MQEGLGADVSPGCRGGGCAALGTVAGSVAEVVADLVGRRRAASGHV